jgi:hypothetical protein
LDVIASNNEIVVGAFDGRGHSGRISHIILRHGRHRAERLFGIGVVTSSRMLNTGLAPEEPLM